ncbi:hypothetical protein NLI96_g7679 [Meripilus lineatus]|uniref:DNA 3'-5' helicase n=1 Tax=Meripilus lineatus TaxID=2056292 RepID=A0AAD5UYN1_9APHY|nr:hypothetical protein NLI96_g7679 [Physisporinus lineatus]
MASSAESRIPDIAEARRRCQEVFGCRLCLWQYKVLEATLKKSNIILDVGTGAGKTLAFFMPLLFQRNGIQIIVTALNVLGNQNVETLNKVDIPAISITAKTANVNNFRAIEEGRYRVVIVNPEELLKRGGGFEKLFKKPDFVSQISNVVFDEAHCISQWGSFRPEYREISRLHYLLPNVPVTLASATFSPQILADIIETLQIQKSSLIHIHLSNDRPNISIGVRRIQHTVHSFQDLAFLIPKDWKEGDPPPPKFVVFFDKISDTVTAGRFLRSLLPPELREKVPWVHSNMTAVHKEQVIRDLRDGKIWGICATDSFGMKGGEGGEEGKKGKRTALENIRGLLPPRKRARVAEEVAEEVRSEDQPIEVDVDIDDAEGDNGEDESESESEDEGEGEGEGDGNGNGEARGDPEMHDIQVDGAGRVVGDEGQPSEEMLAERQAEYHKVTGNAAGEREGKGRRRRRAATTSKLSLVLDDIINADEHGFGCRRLPIKLFFGAAHVGEIIEFSYLVAYLIDLPSLAGAETTTPNECDPTTPAGCSRCQPMPPTTPSNPLICCDIHDPGFFKSLPVSQVVKAKQKKKTSCKSFVPGPREAELRVALDRWRMHTVSTEYGTAFASDIGGSLVLPNGILERIVVCSHGNHIRTVQDLGRETQWSEVDRWGDEILGIIEAHAPKTAAPAPPEASREGTAPRTRRKPSQPSKCSVCRMPGHNSRSLSQ